MKNDELRAMAVDGVITWKELEDYFGERYPEFEKWLRGQTVAVRGVYVWDVERFVAGLPVVD